jgi:hypothetical protein
MHTSRLLVRNALTGAVLALCLIQSACRLVDPHDPNDISLGVRNAGYIAGQFATLTIANQSGRTIGFNLCFATLERSEGGEWVPIVPDDTCTDEMYVLVHGERATYDYLLDSSIPSGTYRFVYTFAPTGNEELTLVTNRFDIDQP